MTEKTMEKKTEDRQYDDRMKQALRQISVFSREWTNQLPSDPGITILENLTAFVLLLQREWKELPEEAGLSILKLLGAVPRKAAPARVLLGCTGYEAWGNVPSHQRFYMGERCFETGEPGRLTGARLKAVCRGRGKTAERLEEGAGKEPVFFFPFGKGPQPGDVLYLIYDRPCGEPGEKVLFHMQVEEPFPRTESENGKMEIRFAQLRWSYSVAEGYAEAECRDETEGFIRSGEIRLCMGKQPHRPQTVAGVEGYVIKCQLLWQEYDVAPRIAEVSGPLLEVWEKETRILSLPWPDPAGEEAPPFCDRDEPKSGLARDLGDRLQSRNVPFGTSGDFDEPPYQTLYAGGRTTGYRELVSGDVLRQGEKGRVVYTGVDAAPYSVLGTLYGYDDQEFRFGIQEETLEESLEIMVERKCANGSRFWFFSPGETDIGSVRYEYDGRLRGIRILDAGDFEGCTVRLSGWTVFHGQEGNVLAGNKFRVPGRKTEFFNPAPGKGGQNREGYEELKSRFCSMKSPLESVSGAEEYEQAVRQIPGLCIHKARAFRDPDCGRAVICVKPWGREPLPRLSARYKKQIGCWLEERRLLGTEFEVRGPRYIPVSAEAAVVAKIQYARPEEAVKQALEQALDYVNGPQTFGAAVSCKKLTAVLMALPCVEQVEQIRLSAGSEGRKWQASDGEELALPEDGLCCPGTIRCTVKRSRIL